MDEFLLTSHLRRADGLKEDVKEAIDEPRSKIPFIVLPKEPRFELTKTRVALDIGGTLVKLVFTTRSESSGEVLLNFKKFFVLSDCIAFLKEKWTDREKGECLHCTGGGSFKYADVLVKELNVKIMRVDEMHSLILGIDFLLKNNEDESFTYHHEAEGIEKFVLCLCRYRCRFQYQPLGADSVYPFLLVNIGTGISVLKVDSPTEFQRVGGSSMGGGAFIGLGNLLTSARSFDELLLLAEKGDHRKVDTLVSDIYGGSYEHLNLAADLIAGSFGKCTRLDRNKSETFKEADIAKSLLLMISNTIGQMAMLYGHRYNLRRIYFGGFFIRKHPITMRTLSYAINFWSKGNTAALFMKHEGYLGAVGSFLNSLPS